MNPQQPAITIPVPKAIYYALTLGITDTFRWNGDSRKLVGKAKRLVEGRIKYFVEVEV